MNIITPLSLESFLMTMGKTGDLDRLTQAASRLASDDTLGVSWFSCLSKLVQLEVKLLMKEIDKELGFNSKLVRLEGRGRHRD